MGKQYMGDGVYAEENDIGQIVLTTENGETVTNTIYLESDVTNNLINFIGQRSPKKEVSFE
jgi:hypothetical protein